ncbi:MAG: DNA adenine methylase [Treponema sp.]|nr:DNA adenine methylase [Treponema sp.]
METVIDQKENEDYLSSQIITYLGNKRSLLSNIEAEINEIKKKLNSSKVVCADLFSGSGIVSRMLKKHSSLLLANDLENYSKVINTCYLCNKKDFPEEEYDKIHDVIIQEAKKERRPGIIAENYAPKDDNNIRPGERVFYTRKNAELLDTYRILIDEFAPESMQAFFLAPLLSQASIHVNTSGVFKGFYKNPDTGLGCFGGKGKNALSRILGQVELQKPLFSNFTSESRICQMDAEAFASEEKGIDIAYLDPPYNQHPYGSNYFMLNLLLKNKIDCDLSRVSGITSNWNRSNYNKPYAALKSLEKVIEKLDAKFIIISYNSEGFISMEEMKEMLVKYGKLSTKKIPYSTFKGSRNLRERSLKVNEYLFILEKN